MKNFWKKYQVYIIAGVAVTGLVLLLLSKKKKPKNSVAKLKAQAKFDRQLWSGKKETDPSMSQTLIEYWKNLGSNYTPAQMQSKSFQKTRPWSSAYVTHLVQGGGFNFKGGYMHSTYAEKSKKDRASGTKDNYWGYRASDGKKVEIGDILIKNRSGGNYNFDTIRSGVISHGDVIIDIIKEGEKITAIAQGGNLNNSVEIVKIPLSNNQKLPSNSPYFMQLKYS
jgi:hypothetical protein